MTSGPTFSRFASENQRFGLKRLAEGVGFEPTVPRKGYNGFRDRPVRPLRHPSRIYRGGPGGRMWTLMPSRRADNRRDSRSRAGAAFGHRASAVALGEALDLGAASLRQITTGACRARAERLSSGTSGLQFSENAQSPRRAGARPVAGRDAPSNAGSGFATSYGLEAARPVYPPAMVVSASRALAIVGARG